MMNEFNLTAEYFDSKNFHGLYHIADSAVALDYEGYPEHETFYTDSEWELTHEFQKVFLSLSNSKDGRALEVSRILRKPMEIMSDKVSNLLNDFVADISSESSKVKYVIYSAHDDQWTNMMNFLVEDYAWIPFASTVTFELKYSAKCLKDTNKASENCFGVSILANGKPLDFNECTGDHFTLHGCSYPEFLDMIKSRWYSGKHADDLD